MNKEQLKKFIENFNIQLFAAPVQGSRIVYLFRVLEDAASATAALLAFQTEGTESLSSDADVTKTKSGSVTTAQDPEITLSVSALLEKGSKEIKDFKAALKKRKTVEAWVVNLDEEGTGDDAGKYGATYYQGVLNSFELESNAEDYASYSLEYTANGVGIEGYATVSDEQMEAASYAFKDTVAQTNL